METKNCRSCGAAIVWMKTGKGKLMPVNADSVRPGDETYTPGIHVSHFATCPQRDSWRKKTPAQMGVESLTESLSKRR